MIEVDDTWMAFIIDHLKSGKILNDEKVKKLRERQDGLPISRGNIQEGI